MVDRNPPETLVERRDYYIEAGRWVFTREYHLRRGRCCGSGCRHCPYTPVAKDAPVVKNDDQNEVQG